jgi:hypothetical protein
VRQAVSSELNEIGEKIRKGEKIGEKEISAIRDTARKAVGGLQGSETRDQNSGPDSQSDQQSAEGKGQSV